MRKLLVFFIFIFLSSVSVLSYAESYPRGLSADSRIKVVMYDPNNVVLIKGRYGYQTDIVFAPNETVEHVAMGDSLAWEKNPVGNNLFIKPTASSKTNMTVLTNVNSYNFLLDATNQNVSPTYKLQFIYPSGGFDQSGNSNSLGTFNPNNVNWQYSYTGSRENVPTSAFDNGQFTYFKFKKGQKLPAIFVVNEGRKETLINYHMEGEYVVVNTTASQYTFRNGSYVTCIYNDKNIGDWDSVKRV